MKIVLFLTLFLFNYITLAQEEIFAKQNFMFSAREKVIGKQKNENVRLFIFFKDKVMIRSVKKEKFIYTEPNNECYSLENDISFCYQDGKIINLLGNYHDVNNDEKIKHFKYTDEFYNEPELECNTLKFDVLYSLFVKNETINGFQSQLCLLDYFTQLKIIVFKDYQNTLRGFVYSKNNDLGCAKFNDFVVYKNKIKDDKKKKKKKKKIKKKKNNYKQELKDISMESYSKMLLKDIPYLKPLDDEKNKNKIVLTIENSIVKYINAFAIDFQLKDISNDDLTNFN